MIINKKLYWTIKGGLFFLGCLALFGIASKLLEMLNLIILLFKLTDTSPEFKLILICISIWVNIAVINVIVNLLFKLQNMINYEYQIFNFEKNDKERNNLK